VLALFAFAWIALCDAALTSQAPAVLVSRNHPLSPRLEGTAD
jgi:hypothetical protein